MKLAVEILSIWIAGSVAFAPLLCWLFWYGERRDRAEREAAHRNNEDVAAADNRVFQ